MKNSLKILGLSLVAVGVTIAVQFRDEWIKAPRVRVGPLVQSITDPPMGTHPESTKRMLRFFVLGDTGTGNEQQYRVARAMENRCRVVGDVHGILLLGDNGYQAGFQSTDDPTWETKVNIPYGSPCLGRLPIYPILGNHDYKGKPEVQIAYSLVNKRWKMPNRFYSLYFSDLVRIVAYDSQTTDYCSIPAFCSIDFLLDQTKNHLEEQLLYPEDNPDENAPKQLPRWTVVMGHHPLSSVSDHGFNHSGGLRGWLFEKIFCNRVDLWFAGHAHHMEHKILPGCRMEHYVLGGGGADLYAIDEEKSEVAFARSSNGFGEFTLDDEQIETRFFDAQGHLIYQHTKQHSALSDSSHH